MAYSYLALGDSYTIGEKVLFKENYPNQVVQHLRKRGIEIVAPEIIAKTGWTTEELQEAISYHHFLKKYDFVSLLIGVNNQYRGLHIADFEIQFASLLRSALHFAGDKTDHVLVISIPDWGVTPFAEGRDRNQIALEIDNYNRIIKVESEKLNVQYLDITKWTREAAYVPSLLADDGLHPSGKEYFRWAEKIATFFGFVL